MNKRLICLDSDSVMTDYLGAVKTTWLDAYGVALTEVMPNAYHCTNAFGVSEEHKQVFTDALYSKFGYEAWRDMPLLPRVKEACSILVQKGYELKCVTSMPPLFQLARQECFLRHGLPINQVYAVYRQPGSGVANPKARVLNELRPAYFADDLLENFQELDPGIHKAWIDGKYADEPNKHLSHLSLHNSTHFSLYEFAETVAAVR